MVAWERGEFYIGGKLHGFEVPKRWGPRGGVPLVSPGWEACAREECATSMRGREAGAGLCGTRPSPHLTRDHYGFGVGQNT
jgi:hypothetical protein